MTHKLPKWNVVIAAALIGSCWAQDQSLQKGELGTLKVLGVHKMSAEEYKRNVEDFVGATYLVRLQFEAPADKSVFVFLPGCGSPFGFVITKKGTEIKWLAPAKGDGTKSPGFDGVFLKDASCWLWMSPGAQKIWEAVTPPTEDGEEEARSVFVKSTVDGRPVEIISSWFTVPEKVAPPPSGSGSHP